MRGSSLIFRIELFAAAFSIDPGDSGELWKFRRALEMDLREVGKCYIIIP